VQALQSFTGVVESTAYLQNRGDRLISVDLHELGPRFDAEMLQRMRFGRDQAWSYATFASEGLSGR
jgi:hypothetical protein